MHCCRRTGGLRIALWPIRRWLVRVALGVAVLVVALVAFRVAFVYHLRVRPCPTAPVPPAATEPIARGARIEVLSYNIEGHAVLLRDDHLQQIASVIRRRQPTVVALQEVHRGSWQARFRDQAAELARLTGMQVVYGPSFSVLGGEFGNAVLARGRIVASRVVRLPSLGEPRSLLAATVDTPQLRLDVYVTHLAAWASLGRSIRARQLRCVRDQLHAARRPFVLCGDFNAVVGLDDLEDPAASGWARLTGLLTEPTHRLMARRWDYIYADPRFEVLDAAVVKEGPSDHWPVTATLAWTAGGTP